MTNNTRSTPSFLWLLLTVVGLGGLLAALAARLRGSQSDTAVLSAPTNDPLLTDTREKLLDVPSHQPAAVAKPAQLGFYLVLLIGFAAALVMLQERAPQIAAVLFVLIIAGSVGLGTWQSRARLAAAIGQRTVGLRALLATGMGPAAVVYTWVWQHRVSLAATFTLLALALLALSVWQFGLTSMLDDVSVIGNALVFLAGGTLALLVALALRRDVVAQAALVRLPMPAVIGRSNWFVTGAGVLALAFMTDFNRHEHAYQIRFPISTDVQFILLVIGVILVIVGLAGLRSTGGLVRHLFTGSRSRLVMLLLLAITLLGLGLRVWSLQDSMRFFVDEESFASAMRILRLNEDVKLLAPFSSISAFPYLYPYLQEQTVALFGSDLFGLRMAGVILGTLAIPALYLLARTLFDLKTALLAALLLATFPPHIHFSRIAISEIAGPLFGTLALAFMARALRDGRRFDFAAAGAMLGMTHYFHEGGRIFYTPLFALWVVCGILFIREERRIPWRGLLTTVLGLVIVATPVYITLIGLELPLFARMVNNNSGLAGGYWQSLLEADKLKDHLLYHVVPTFLVYINWPDSTLFYMGQYALVLPLLQPLLLLGLIVSLFHWRKPGMLLLALWVFSTSAGNSLMVDSSGSPRYVMVFPALALAFAVGLRYTLPLLWSLPLPRMLIRIWVGRQPITLRWPPRRREHRFPRELMALGLAAACVQAVYYYGEHLPMYNTQFRLAMDYADGYDAALRSAVFLPTTDIYVIAPDEVNEIETKGLLSLLREDLHVRSIPSRRFTRAYIREISCQNDVAFYIEPDDPNTLRKLQANFFLRAPERSPYADIIPDERELVLYYAPYVSGMEKKYERCEQK